MTRKNLIFSILVSVILIFALCFFPKQEVHFQTEYNLNLFSFESINIDGEAKNLSKKPWHLLVNNSERIFAIKIPSDSTKLTFDSAEGLKSESANVFCTRSSPFYVEYAESKADVISPTEFSIDCSSYSGFLNYDFIYIILLVALLVYFVSSSGQVFQDKKSVFIFSCFVIWGIFLGYLCFNLPFHHGPDEYMRFLSSSHYFDNNVPISVAQTYYANKIWGTNYLIGMPDFLHFINMKIAKILWYFIDLERYILARISQIFILLIVVFSIIKFSALKYSAYLLLILLLIPQASFMFTYVNTDATSFVFAIFGFSLLLNKKIPVAYSFGILIMILLNLKKNYLLLGLPAAYIYMHRKDFSFVEMLKDTKVILLFFMVGIAEYIYVFLDQYINNMKHVDITLANAHEVVVNKINNSINNNFRWEVLQSGWWYIITFWSFFGYLGQVDVQIHLFVIFIIFLLFLATLYQKDWKIGVAIALIFILNLSLSLYHSMTYDFQAQGRYLYPFLAFCVVFMRPNFKYACVCGVIGVIISVNSFLYYLGVDNLGHRMDPEIFDYIINILKNENIPK